MAGSSVAQLTPASGMRSSQMGQLSPATSSLGQAALGAVEQNRVQQMLNQAMQTFQAQNFQQAYQMTEAILQINPAFTDALVLKAQILAASGQFQEALRTVQETVQRDPNNALGWSMAAALLANLGQLPEAMSAVDRSISIDPSNSETHSIKEMIREKLAEVQFDTGKRSRLSDGGNTSDTGKSFALAALVQVVALFLGIAGAFLPMFAPSLPKPVSIALDSIALSLLIINAGRGAFLYGIKRFALTFVLCLIAGGLAGLIAFSVVKTTPLSHFLLDRLSASYFLLTPMTVLIFWLGAATILPLLTGLIALIAGISARARNQ
jgi:tetratricopeptide (TPR) repeat protein